MAFADLLQRIFNDLSAEWQINLNTKVDRKELYQARITSSKPSLGFFRFTDFLSRDCHARADLK